MNRYRLTSSRRALASVALATCFLFGGSEGFSFTSLHVKRLVASVKTAASLPPVLISHKPLLGVSPVTRQAIIQGEVGTHPRSLAPSFPQRITAQALPSAGSDELIQVVLRYKVIPEGFSADPRDISDEKMGPLFGGDPFAFAFQITQSSITSGRLLYKILVQRVQRNGSQVNPFGPEYSFPPEAVANPDSWVSAGVEAGAAQSFDVDGGRIHVFDGNPNDGEAFLDIPSSLFQGPANLSFIQLSPTDPSIPRLAPLPDAVSVYRLVSDQPFTGLVRATALYPDFIFPQNPGEPGEDGIIDGTSLSEKLVSLAWWDGFEWRLLGGKADFQANTVTGTLGFFKFLAVVPAGAPAPRDLRPRRKIITPNGDGVNDTAIFDFGGVGQTAQIEIFDMTGHRVRAISGSGQLKWDGRDSSGASLESGVYLYQYSVNGERVSGLIAVAK